MPRNMKQVYAIQKKNKELHTLDGQRFGRLVAIERVEDAVNPNGKHSIRYRCKCDCGNEKIVRKCHLKYGGITSCGCLQRETIGNIRRKHGYSHKERLYSVWLDMKERCRNPKNIHYKSYGGRGICVCDEWKDNYISFRNWCYSNGYKEEIRESGRNNLTLDRIDTNGNYEPGNCRFITNRENCLNKRNTMSDFERYKKCPICGNEFQLKKRNGQKTCSVKCGHVLKSRNYTHKRSENGRLQKK